MDTVLERAVGRRVLVVDDEPSVRAVVRMTLELDGWEVTEAGNGAHALDVLEALGDDPLVLLLDIMMPELDGLSLLGRLRHDERWAELPIVMLSAKQSPTDRAMADRLGADDFIAKPFDPVHLANRLLVIARTSHP